MMTDLGRPTNKAHLSAITVTNISRIFYLQDGCKNQLAYRYGAKLRHSHRMYSLAPSVKFQQSQSTVYSALQ